MRVLVCGGRDFSNKILFRETMDRIHVEAPISLIIQGGATGADWYAKYWASSRGIASVEYAAEWIKYGPRRAGPIRNYRMLKEGKPDLVVAFPGGNGTADMVKKAKKANVKVIEVSMGPN